MSNINFLVEVKDCPKCNALMFWWKEHGNKEWRCDACDHKEPHQSSGETAK